MNKQERLFSVIGGVDEALLERSEKNIQSRKSAAWMCWGAAACLILVLLGTIRLYSTPPDSGFDQPDDPTVGCDPVDVSPDSPGQAAQFPRGGTGSFHLLQFTVPAEDIQGGSPAPEQIPAFYLFVDETVYFTTESGGVLTIQPILDTDRSPGPPTCYLEISHMSNTSPQAAAESTCATLSAIYQEVSEISESSGRLCLRAGNGTDWDDLQREVDILEDGSGGVFLLSVNYFLEAAEGHGVRLRDIANTFRILDGDSDAWMGDLRDAADALTRGALTDQWPQELLAEDAMVSCYGRDVSGEISVAGIDCTVDDTGDTPTAVVSVRLNQLEDSADFLTMELHWTGSGWLADFAGLEK